MGPTWHPSLSCFTPFKLCQYVTLNVTYAGCPQQSCKIVPTALLAAGPKRVALFLWVGLTFPCDTDLRSLFSQGPSPVSVFILFPW